MPPRKRATAVPMTTAEPPDEPTLTRPDAPPTAARAASGKASSKAEDEAPKRVPHKQRSVYLPEDIWQRARAAVAYITYFDVEGVPDTMAAIVSAGLEVEVARLEAELNKGKPFRPAARRLTTGPGRAGASRLQGPRGRRTDAED